MVIIHYFRCGFSEPAATVTEFPGWTWTDVMALSVVTLPTFAITNIDIQMIELRSIKLLYMYIEKLILVGGSSNAS